MAEELFNIVSLVSLAYTAITLVVCFALSRLLGKNVSQVDKLVLWWILWDVLIHLSLELPFVVISLTGTVNDSSSVAALTWKEYGKADSRWLYSDPTVVSLEILTAVVLPPICLLLVYAICLQRPYRHWLQLVLCTSELYGGWMTFCPEWLTGSKALVTDNPLYLWCYLIFFNGLWVVIPIALMFQSWIQISSNTKPVKASSKSGSQETKSITREEQSTGAASSGGLARRRKQKHQFSG